MKKIVFAASVFLVLLLVCCPMALALSKDTGLVVKADGEVLSYNSKTATFSGDLGYGPAEVELYCRAEDGAAAIVKADSQTVAQPKRTYSKEYTVAETEGASLHTEIVVRAEDGTEKIYTVQLNRPAKLQLSRLIVSRSENGPAAYDPQAVDEGVYAVTVAAGETTLYIRAEAAAAGAEITLKPVDYGEKLQEVNDGEYRFDIGNELRPSEARTFRLTIAAGEYRSRSFDLSITRGVAGGDDATLSGICFRGAYRNDDDSNLLYFSPVFHPDTLHYTLYLPADIANFTVWPEPAAGAQKATVTVNGATWLGSGTYKDLSARTQQVEVAVTAENLLDRRTYTFDVVKADEDGGAVAALTELRLVSSLGGSAALPLSPAFSTETSQYTATVSTSQSRLYVYPTLSAKSQGAVVFVNGTQTVNGYQAVDLQAGANTIKVAVLSADYSSRREYTLTVYRGSGVTGLSSLSLRTSQGEAVNYSPLFTSGNATYVANVYSRSTGLSFAPTAAAAGSVITLTQGSGQVYTLNSDGWSRDFELQEGNNSFTLAVTSPGGQLMSYSFSVYRRPAYVSCQVSNQGLLVNGTEAVCAAYNINGNNFFKLRDVAALLSGGAASVGVSYDEASRRIALTSGNLYQPVGGELVRPGLYQNVSAGNQQVLLDGEPVFPMAYNIDGNNYFLLRDLGILLGFAVDYQESSRRMTISF